MSPEEILASLHYCCSILDGISACMPAGDQSSLISAASRDIECVCGSLRDYFKSHEPKGETHA